MAAVVARSDGGVNVTGFLGSTWLTAAGLDKAQRRELDLAIDAADPGRLHRIDSEFAPCWCPTCEASYCQAHWRTEVQGADDHPGWYEATYGTCPEGHRRKLDD